MTSGELPSYETCAAQVSEHAGVFTTTLHAAGPVVVDTAGRLVATFSNLWQAEALVWLVDEAPWAFNAWADDLDALVVCQEQNEEYSERIAELVGDLEEVQQEVADLKKQLALATRERI